jgi:hypothetical protein
MRELSWVIRCPEELKLSSKVDECKPLPVTSAAVILANAPRAASCVMAASVTPLL